MSDARNVARDAALQSLVSEGVFLLVMVGLTLWITRREWLILQARRVQAVVRQESRGWHAEREIADFRRQVSEHDHSRRES